MTWSAKGGGDFQDPEAGTHIARCVAIIDMGTQKEEYQGKPKIARKTCLKWELPEQLIPEGEHKGKPFVVMKIYTASLGEKATLRTHLVNWRGKQFTPEEAMGFDEKNLLDKCCYVMMAANEQGKVKVSGLAKLPQGVVCPPRVHDLLYFSMEKGRFDRKVFDGLSDWFKDKIRLSPEWAELNGEQGHNYNRAVDTFDDDIPF